MTIEEVRNHAKEKGLSEKRIAALIAELHPDENGKLSLEESAQALVTVNHMAATIENTRNVLAAVKAIRSKRGTTEAEKKAKKKYRDKGKRLTVDFYPSEADLISHIESQPNKQGYIKSLIREDMGKPKGKWAIIGENCCVCSVCHKHSIADYYFCPECGAEMERGGENA